MTTADRKPPTADESSDRSPETVARQRARVAELQEAAETRTPFVLPAALGVLALLMVIVRAMQSGVGAIGPAMFWSGVFIAAAGALETIVFFVLRAIGDAPAITIPHALLRFLAVNGFHFAILFIAGMIGGTIGMYDPARAAPIVFAVLLSAIFFSFLFELDLQDSIVPIALLIAAQLVPSLAVQNYSRTNTYVGRTIQREFRPPPANVAPSDTVVIPGAKPAGTRREEKPVRSEEIEGDESTPDKNAARKTAEPLKEAATKSEPSATQK